MSEIHKTLREANTRWLRANEVCQILQNYLKFHISTQPPYKPPSGSLYLYDKTVLRNFRKDGYNWRKKKDGKTVSEAHERLKCSSVEVLHCYYAHGEETPTFQRRCYWLLDERFMKIVLVHYREVDKNSSRLKIRPSDSSCLSPPGSMSLTSGYISGVTYGGTSPPGSTSLTSGFTNGVMYGGNGSDDNESAVFYDAVSSWTPSPNSFVPISNSYYDMNGNLMVNPDELESVYSNSPPSSLSPPSSYDPNSPPSSYDLRSIYNNICNMHGNHVVNPQDFVSAGCANYGSVGVMPERVESLDLGNNMGKKVFGRSLGKKYWEEDNSLQWPLDQNYVADANGVVGGNFHEGNPIYKDLYDISQTFGMQYDQQNGFQAQFSNAEIEYLQNSFFENGVAGDSNGNNTTIGDQPLQKIDSFNDWLSRELGEEDSSRNTVDMLLHTRLCKLLYSVSISDPESIEYGSQESLMEQLDTWLLQKVSEDGKGPKVMDQEGQGVIHLASALGYDWAIPRVVAAGVSINFRDVNGWSALHWAAFSGRERTVAHLMVMDAALDAVTDPTPSNPSGLTPYDVARANGHAGMSGFLGGCCLKYLCEKLSVQKETQVVPKRSSTEYLNLPDTPQKALGEATQNVGTLDQRIRCLSLESKDDKRAVVNHVRVKTRGLPGHDKPAHLAAISINKSPVFKAQKEFIIKIQDKEEREKFVRAVKILEKYVLRWLRKRKRLCGFKLRGPNDFLKQGRNQSSERNMKALARVKSMVQCQDAWDQYIRLVKHFMELGEIKAVDEFLNFSDDLMMDGVDEMSHFDDLLYDDTSMSME